MIDFIDKLAQQTIDNRSEPSPIALRQDNNVDDSSDINEPYKSPINAGFVRDDSSNLFDPNIHAVDSDGKPVLTKTGKFAKKRGRRGGYTNQSVDTSQIAAKQTSKQLGRATAFLIFASGQSIFGNEWKPIKDKEKGIDEEAMMQDAWAEYYLATGKKDLPPWLGVAVVCTMYALPRFAMPKTQERMTGLKGTIQRWKEKRQKRKENK